VGRLSRKWLSVPRKSRNSPARSPAAAEAQEQGPGTRFRTISQGYFAAFCFSPHIYFKQQLVYFKQAADSFQASSAFIPSSRFIHSTQLIYFWHAPFITTFRDARPLSDRACFQDGLCDVIQEEILLPVIARPESTKVLFAWVILET
jgi:hypothetical protein